MDFNRPNVENETAADLADLRQGRLDQARGFDPAVIEEDPSNKPEGMIRWNSVLKKFQKLVSAAWADLADLYAINISGNAATASKLSEPVNIAGVPFDGSVNINLPGVNQAGTQTSTGVTGLTANRALVSNGSGNLAVSAVTATELGYLDGVTSAIQTQLNNKAPLPYNGSSSTTTSLPIGTHVVVAVAASRAARNVARTISVAAGFNYMWAESNSEAFDPDAIMDGTWRSNGYIDPDRAIFSRRA